MQIFKPNPNFLSLFPHPRRGFFFCIFSETGHFWVGEMLEWSRLTTLHLLSGHHCRVNCDHPTRVTTLITAARDLQQLIAVLVIAVILSRDGRS